MLARVDGVSPACGRELLDFLHKYMLCPVTKHKNNPASSHYALGDGVGLNGATEGSPLQKQTSTDQTSDALEIAQKTMRTRVAAYLWLWHGSTPRFVPVRHPITENL